MLEAFHSPRISENPTRFRDFWSFSKFMGRFKSSKNFSGISMVRELTFGTQLNFRVDV